MIWKRSNLSWKQATFPWKVNFCLSNFDVPSQEHAGRPEMHVQIWGREVDRQAFNLEMNKKKLTIKVSLSIWAFTKGWSIYQDLPKPRGNFQLPIHKEYPTCKPFGLLRSTHASHLRRGDSNWENAPIRLACRQTWGGVFLIGDWCGRAQTTVGSATLGWVVLDHKRKQTEQARRSKPVSRVPSWPLFQVCLQLPAFRFLPWLLWSWPENCEADKPFPSCIAFSHCV